MELCLSDNLKLLRQKNGYSMETLAEKIAVSRQTIAKWESGETCPDVLNTMKIAKLYNVSLDELASMPMRELYSCAFENREGKACGILDVTDEGSITLPGTVREMFDINPGDKVLLLADVNQGIAIIKCEQF